MGYGVRAVLVVALLALVCRWGVAQVGPRYVIELAGATAPAASRGQLQLAGKGLVLVRFQDLRLLVVEADGEAYSQYAVRGWPAADLLLVLPASAGRYDGLAPLRTLPDGMPVVVAEQGGAGAGDGAKDGATAGAGAGPRWYPMQPWNALDLRKHGTRLRVTAMPGAAGTVAMAGYLIEVGNSRASYRLYAGAAGLTGVTGTTSATSATGATGTTGATDAAGAPGAIGAAAAELARRLPGADLALLPGQDGPQLLALNRGAPPAHVQPAALTAAGHVFTPLRR
ncbi:hypothetical protein FHW58_004516 [Duganella sp. 1224]|uniref:hypothetical protein n=1 Tax=Duganella sp. 1224 TaxID=2587052 RepID=UPI0015CDBD9A|nr:hypothetical protein [Duganella sp. 1224]NYE63288.1 hypothetical protein [Duganella sp. 1224]